MMEENQKASKLSNISFWILFVTAILLPVFFIPGGILSLSFSKSLLVFTGISLALILLFLHVFKSGKFVLPKTSLSLSVLLVLISFFLSAAFSENFERGAFGYGFEIGTFSFIFLLFSVFFLAFFLFQNGKRIGKAPLILIIPFIVLSVYHLLKFFFGWDLISFGGVFADKINTPLGGFNEIGILSGVVTLLSVVILDTLGFRNTPILYRISFFLGLLMMIAINFWLSWILLLAAVILFGVLRFFSKNKSTSQNASQNGSVATIVQNKNTGQVGQDIVFQNKSSEVVSPRIETPNKSSRLPLVTVIVALISLVFIFPSGTAITEKVYGLFGINYTEVRLSIQGTGEIISHTLKQDKKSFFLGAGPNNFLPEWRAGKPESVNLTNFWNTEFHYAIGLIPTFFVTTGILGIIAWLFFLLSFCIFGLKYVYSNPKNWTSVSLFFVSLYLWLITIFYLPSHALFMFAALFSGIFLASASTPGRSTKGGRNFILISICFVFLAVNILSTFFIYQKTVGAANFEKGLSSFSAGNLKDAESYFKKAVTVSESDVYRRYLSEFYVLKLRQFAQDVKDPTPEQVKTFEELFKNAKENIEIALTINPNNLENRIQLGKIYQFLAEIKTEGAYKTAKEVYLGAQALDPKNPLLNFLLANLEVTSGTLDEALKYVTAAITLKPNFGDAMLLHSRIKFLQGDIPGAIVSAIETIKIFPQEPYLYFHLGLLYYQKEEYQNAVLALNEAIKLLPDFANARYFSGLSLSKLGKNAEAIVEFEKIEATNPENAEVKLILTNLRAGKDPFFEAKPPTDVKPEKRSELPLDEKEE